MNKFNKAMVMSTLLNEARSPEDKSDQYIEVASCLGLSL